MGLETGTFISDLVVTNPTITDKRREGDDHFRLLKNTIKNTFPNLTGAMNATQAELNFVVGVTSALQTQLDAKVGTAGAGSTKTGQTLDVIAGLGIVVNADDVQIEISALAALEGNALAATDGWLVDDGGVPKRMSYTDAGILVIAETTTLRTLVAADANHIIRCTNAAAVSIVLNTGVLKNGNWLIIEQNGAGQVTLSGTATLNSAVGLKTRVVDSVIMLYMPATDVATVYGDGAV